MKIVGRRIDKPGICAGEIVAEDATGAVVVDAARGSQIVPVCAAVDRAASIQLRYHRVVPRLVEDVVLDDDI